MEIIKENISKQTGRRCPVLKNEIQGMEIIVCTLPAGEKETVEPETDTAVAFIFTRGQGTCSQGEASFPVSETALFAPEHTIQAEITASSSTPLVFLELRIAVSEKDCSVFTESSAKYPFLKSWSTCETYKEKIKSEKTVNRMLLPEFTFPRLCIGAVQTTGPDTVGRHDHPMLEQLFFGLQDNRCRVLADDASAEFLENDLLHIPLGSSHGVEVDPGFELNYIWIDLFRDHSGMEYIASEHVRDN